jgi:hypothetical protein
MDYKINNELMSDKQGKKKKKKKKKKFSLTFCDETKFNNANRTNFSKQLR